MTQKNLIASTLAAGLMLVAAAPSGQACTNYIVTKGASKNGSCIVSYAADSHTLYGELYHYPAAQNSPKSMRQIKEWDTGKILGEIPEASLTYNVVGNMNEHALAISETTFGGREELVDSTGLIDYGSLIYLTLQRSRNAREAIQTISHLVETYGYYSSGESFSIADTSEVWIMELIGKGSKPRLNAKKKPFGKGAVWVAVRIPDGYVSGHANQARIQRFALANGKTSITSKDMKKKINLPSLEVVYSADVIDFARACGYFAGKDSDFSFSDIYNPVDFGGARFCDARVWAFFRAVNPEMEQYVDYALGHNLSHRMPLYVKPDRKLDVLDVAQAMRNHFEDTPMDMRTDIGAGAHGLPYRWRPLTWKVDDVEYVNERAPATQQTGFWFVAESRPNLPTAIGGVLWFGVDDAATSCLTPIYCGVTSTPECFRVGNGDMLTYSHTAAFWTFNRVSNFAYLRYDLISQDIIKQQQDWEKQQVGKLPSIDQEALKLYRDNPALGKEFITQYSCSTALMLHQQWHDLSNYLIVKHIDGNVKRETGEGFERTETNQCPAPLQPVYPEKWRRAMVNDNGEILKVR